MNKYQADGNVDWPHETRLATEYSYLFHCDNGTKPIFVQRILNDVFLSKLVATDAGDSRIRLTLGGAKVFTAENSERILSFVAASLMLDQVTVESPTTLLVADCKSISEGETLWLDDLISQAFDNVCIANAINVIESMFSDVGKFKTKLSLALFGNWGMEVYVGYNPEKICFQVQKLLPLISQYTAISYPFTAHSAINGKTSLIIFQPLIQ